MVTAVPTIAVFPDEKLTLEQRIEKWVWHYCRALEANYDCRYPNSSDPVRFSIESGRKYWKIIQNHGGVHAFVNKKTGEVYKPASWSAPHTKYVRFDLRIIKDREKLHNPLFTDWAGGYLYLR